VLVVRVRCAAFSAAARLSHCFAEPS